MSRPLVLTAAEMPTTPEPGVYDGVPFSEYAAWNAFSKSMVPAALRSGAHLDHYIHGARKPTAALNFGSLVDCLVLEPDKFDQRYAIQPATYTSEKTTGRGTAKVTEQIEKPWNMNSRTCQQIAADLAASGKDLVTEHDLARARAVVESIMQSGVAAPIIAEGKKQVSIVWVDEKTGVLCKGRADIIHGCSVIDLKTARDASPDDFTRAIGKFLYHVQAFAYLDGLKQNTRSDYDFRFIVAENSDETRHPAVALYTLDSVSIVAGGLMWRRALERVASWRSDGIRGYSQWFEPITAPRWIVDREIAMSEEEIEF